jgi:hypothetical protein
VNNDRGCFRLQPCILTSQDVLSKCTGDGLDDRNDREPHAGKATICIQADETVMERQCHQNSNNMRSHYVKKSEESRVDGRKECCRVECRLDSQTESRRFADDGTNFVTLPVEVNGL